MDDYSALAQRISVSVSGVSSALILSRDGLVLGAYPAEDESLAKPAWLRFTALGEPERGFVEFPDQVWAYVKRGPYAAFAIAEAGVRPGVLVDQMEQVLLAAEDGRSRRDTLRLPDANAAPSGKPRTSLHPQVGKPVSAEVAEVAASPRDQTSVADGGRADRGGFSRDAGSSGGRDDRAPTVADEDERASVAPLETPAEGPGAVPSTLKKEPPKLVGQSAGSGVDEESEVDRVLLAKEFSGLLQLDSDDDEGSS